MKADQAATLSADARRKLDIQERERQAEDRRNKDKDIERAKTVGVPFALSEIHKDIRAAAQKGLRTVNHCMSYRGDISSHFADVDRTIINGVTDILKKEGYKVTSKYESGTTDYGDFNAPCRVDWSHMRLTITW